MSKAHITAEQIEVREGLEPTLVANKIATAVALGEGLPETDFDYDSVPAQNRDEVHRLTKSLKGAVGRNFAVIVEIGDSLWKAKELVGHGNFLPWLQAEFRWSERTARNYMTIAAHFQGKTANFADIDLTTASKLIAAPAEVRDEIFKRAKAGEAVSKAEVRATLRKGRCADRQTRSSGLQSAHACVPRRRPNNRGLVLTSGLLLEIETRRQAEEVAKSLRTITAELARCRDVDSLLEALTEAEVRDVRAGVEAVERLKAALEPEPQRRASGFH